MVEDGTHIPDELQQRLDEVDEDPAAVRAESNTAHSTTTPPRLC